MDSKNGNVESANKQLPVLAGLSTPETTLEPGNGGGLD